MPNLSVDELMNMKGCLDTIVAESEAEESHSPSNYAATVIEQAEAALEIVEPALRRGEPDDEGFITAGNPAYFSKPAPFPTASAQELLDGLAYVIALRCKRIGFDVNKPEHCRNLAEMVTEWCAGPGYAVVPKPGERRQFENHTKGYSPPGIPVPLITLPNVAAPATGLACPVCGGFACDGHAAPDDRPPAIPGANDPKLKEWA